MPEFGLMVDKRKGLFNSVEMLIICAKCRELY